MREPIDLDRLLATVWDPGLGGTALFVGTVRAGPEDGAVTAIEYSAYAEMLEAEFEQIAAEAAGRWPGCRIGAAHRLGRVEVGAPSIAVVVAAAHRAAAFDACRYVVEEAKRRLPVWKKEYFAEGGAEWREG